MARFSVAIFFIRAKTITPPHWKYKFGAMFPAVFYYYFTLGVATWESVVVSVRKLVVGGVHLEGRGRRRRRKRRRWRWTRN